MSNKCGVVNCLGNYNENKPRVFHLPKEQSERQKWLDVLSPRENFVVNPDKFFICEIHWSADSSLIKLRGGSMRPGIPPSIFNVPASCQPSPKPAPRSAKVEDQQLSSHISLCRHRGKKLVYLTRQLELLSQKQFSKNDYCFALQSCSKCNYEQLRDFLVLPCKRKLQYITSSIDKDQVLRETFDQVQTLQQKNVFLLVDEVQIRPTVSFSGGVLSGMVENNLDWKATSMLS
ncbi:Zinc finger C2CH-type [Trinorchestia longiramus]|nr:Zinc finger C2CH-type [Trinorchestia longiramus]